MNDDKRMTRFCLCRFGPYDRIVQFWPASGCKKKWEIIPVRTQCATFGPSVETIDDDGHKLAAMTTVFADYRHQFDFLNCSRGSLTKKQRRLHCVDVFTVPPTHIGFRWETVQDEVVGICFKNDIWHI